MPETLGAESLVLEKPLLQFRMSEDRAVVVSKEPLNAPHLLPSKHCRLLRRAAKSKLCGLLGECAGKVRNERTMVSDAERKPWRVEVEQCICLIVDQRRKSSWCLVADLGECIGQNKAIAQVWKLKVEMERDDRNPSKVNGINRKSWDF